MTKWLVKIIFPQSIAEISYNTRRRAVDCALANEARGNLVEVYRYVKGVGRRIEFLRPNR